MFEKANKSFDRILLSLVGKCSYHVCDLKRYGVKFRDKEGVGPTLKNYVLYQPAFVKLPNYDKEIPVILSYRPFEGYKLAGIDLSPSNEQLRDDIELNKKLIVDFMLEIWHKPEISFRYLAPKLRKVAWLLVFVCLLVMASSVLAMCPSLIEMLVSGHTVFDFGKVTAIFKYTSCILLGLLLFIYVLHYNHKSS